ncbi:MAG: methylenetetrahydrofolate--tRNA-(uracil(54)-C(5))-methyltransferase (FADH(2)-oxidizing) TrmFO [Halobacteriovorax sp.]|nr:methylenetetrahydrofolate--tRNA-(uracil(54)-C(5))-methyltransferase (FADH(2)-oxidizing) TrmFO [Halobacteriovorax sp.]|tara:strand:- start:74192 stop:75556 length:1365 start_codon:yes stop_codon:yes gene_type:complete
MKTLDSKVLVVGAGLAGSDAAWYLANKGVQVILAEVKKQKLGPAQKIDTFAELVCTNSLKSLNPDSGHGLLKNEMKALGSLILEVGHEHAVPAGDALAVDRDKFSAAVSNRLEEHKNIKILNEEVADPIKFAKKYDAEFIIVASGPLTTEPLSQWITDNIGGDDFYFYDAIAPVVDADSLDFSKMYFKDRHKPYDESEGEADYLNVPLEKEAYQKFINDLIEAEKVPAQNFEEEKFFEACLPIDLMAERGEDTPRFGPMKPIGLEKEDGSRPYACIQLRKENLLGSAYNLVGFQTRLKYPDQVRVFKTLPGFEEASFIHLGSVHRNSFLNAKKLLNFDLSSKEFPKLHFAGQMTGVEGYTESATMGLYVACQIWRKINGKESFRFPVETGIGALVNYIMTVSKPTPSNINFGLLPTVELTKEERRKRKERKKIKKAKASARAREVFSTIMGEIH